MTTKLAERVRELRGKESRRLFGNRIGVADRTVMRWEQGGSIEPENLERLARATGKPVAYFMDAPVETVMDADVPHEIATFLQTPLGQECTEDERDHLIRYYRSDGPLRSMGVIQMVLTAYRGVQDDRELPASKATRAQHRADSDSARKREVDAGEYNVISHAPRTPPGGRQ